MEHLDLMEKLSDKIEELLAKYQELSQENDTLRRELLTCKAASQEKDKEIERLRDELAMKNMEVDEIIKRIESFMG